MPRTVASSARFALMLLLAAPLPAFAQTAKELHERGVQALHDGRYAEAVQALDASYRKEQVPSALYNLGLAYKAMGHPDKALEAFEGYVRFADPKREKKNIDAVRSEIDRLKGAYARFALKLTPDDATIEIDSKPATPSKGELWVATGKHRITVRAFNYETYEQELEVVAGRFDLEVRLRAPSGPPEQRAAMLVDSGMALQASGNLQAAMSKYNEAQLIYPTPRATAQIGLTEESLGDLASAERHLIEATAARKDPYIRENRSRLKKALARIKGQLSTLDIKGTPDGAEVTVNDRKAGVLPLIPGIRVAGGAITVRAKKEGYTDFDQVIDLPPRGKRLIRIDMVKAPPKVVAPVVVAPPPQPVVPALPQQPIAPLPAAELPPPEPIVAAPAEKSTQSDIEAYSDARKDLADAPEEIESATGFEMAINLGYQPWLGSQKLADSDGLLSAQIVLGARLIWPFSFGLILNGGGASTDTTDGVFGANPGLYVRGHIQQEKKQFGVDVWAGTGIQPWAVQVAVFKADEVDINAVDPNTIDASDVARQMAGIKVVRTLESINVPIDLGVTFYVTESIGIDLAAALTFWLPQQRCDHDDFDKRFCIEDGLKSQTSLFFGAGIAFLP